MRPPERPSTLKHNGGSQEVSLFCPLATRGTQLHDSVLGFDESRFPIGSKEVVEPSLAGLRLGEVIFVPVLDDPALTAKVRESERQLLERAVRGNLAERYTA